ncbi:MAG: alcohol dehydrogenase catalytic domain-containing protein [Dehalococcoidia bacterium]|jgi:(R,R)-butanediol dehydrogenase/meso-butanediol dehydrogenase/diacetyl reductase
MKALRLYGRRDLRYDDVPEPSPGPGQLKIKVSLAGICGSDIKVYTSGSVMIPPERVPLTIGHEYVGRVAEVGEGVTGFEIGDRVSGVGNWYCGECYCCKKGYYNICINQNFIGLSSEGCFAEYFVIPAYSCYRLPESVSDEAGAMVEPLAVALHAVRKGNVQLGDTVAIVGDGTIGLCALAAARVAGASAVYLIAKHRGRGELARKMGVNEVIYIDEGEPVERLEKLTGGIGADVVLECVGRPETPQLAVNLTRRHGVVVIVGVFAEPGLMDFGTILFTERSIVGSSIYIDEGRTAVDLMSDGRIDPTPMITSTVPLENAVREGFDKLIDNKEDNIKILLKVS